MIRFLMEMTAQSQITITNHCNIKRLITMHFCILAPAGVSKPSPKPAKKTSGPALGKPETPADAAKNWLSSAMAEAKTPSANTAAASMVSEREMELLDSLYSNFL